MKKMSNFTSKNNRFLPLQADETILPISQEAEDNIEQEHTVNQKFETMCSSNNKNALLLHLAFNLTLNSSKNNIYLNSSSNKIICNLNHYILYSRGYITNTEDRKDRGMSINNKNEDRD